MSSGDGCLVLNLEPGTRVVVRYLLPNGRATDALGMLLAATADELVVDGKRGVEHIRVADVVAAKPVPPPPARRPPRSTLG